MSSMTRDSAVLTVNEACVDMVIFEGLDARERVVCSAILQTVLFMSETGCDPVTHYILNVRKQR